MLREQTIDSLRTLRLKGMADAYISQSGKPDTVGLSFDDRFALIVDHELIHRKNQRLSRLLKEARLRMPACIEDLNYTHHRGLEKRIIASLRTCQWIENKTNILISGPTGIGKTYIACALGNLACRSGYRTQYYRLNRLLSEVLMSKGDGTYPSLLSKLSKMDVLIIDDFGLLELSQADSRDLLDIIEDRSQTRSTIVASQLPFEQWHEAFADPTMADAILDRLVHNAHKLALSGESMRKAMSRTPEGS